MAVALLAGVWTVFLALGLGTLLAPPLAAVILIFLLFPYRSEAWAARTMGAAGTVATLWLLSRVESIVWVAGLGLFTAYILNPPVTWLERRGVRRPHAALYMILPAVAIVGVILFVFVPKLLGQAREFLNNLPDYVRTVEERYVARFRDLHPEDWPIDVSALVDRLTQSLNSVVSGAGEGIVGLARRTATAISIFVLTPVVGYHLLKDFPTIRRNTLRVLPRRVEPEVETLLSEMDLLVGGWLRGQMTVAALVGLLTVIALLIVRLPYGPLIGVFAGAMNMVPIVGYWISLAVAVIVALTTQNPGPMALMVIVSFLVIQLIEQNFLSPKIVAQHTGLHPVAVLLSLLVFASLGGLAGALLAIPCVLLLRVFFRRYVAERLRQAGGPTQPPTPAAQ